MASTCYVYSDWLELGARSGMYWRLCAVVLQGVLGLAKVTRASHGFFWAARGAFGNRWRLYALVPNFVFGESDPRRTSPSVPTRGLPTPNLPPSSSSERALLPCTTRKQKHKAQEVGDESPPFRETRSGLDGALLVRCSPTRHQGPPPSRKSDEIRADHRPEFRHIFVMRALGSTKP